MCEIEAIVDSRLIADEGNESVTALTPSHFLTGRCIGVMPDKLDLETTQDKLNLKKHYPSKNENTSNNERILWKIFYCGTLALLQACTR